MFHDERMYDFRTKAGQFSRLARRNFRNQSCCGDFPGVGGTALVSCAVKSSSPEGLQDTIDLLEDLKLLGLDTNCNKRSSKVRVASTDESKNSFGDRTKEASDDRNIVPTL
jgi:hypothetical protein